VDKRFPPWLLTAEYAKHLDRKAAVLNKSLDTKKPQCFFKLLRLSLFFFKKFASKLLGFRPADIFANFALDKSC
jgi:hypothetical protein